MTNEIDEKEAILLIMTRANLLLKENKELKEKYSIIKKENEEEAKSWLIKLAIATLYGNTNEKF